MTTPKPVIGIIGAGKLGITLAQLATRAGYTVLVAGSGDAAKIALTVEILAPGATSHTTRELARIADIIILALPLSNYTQLSAEQFSGKLVIDAMNYWWEVDGDRYKVVPDTVSSSEAVQAHLAESRIVKAFNHIGYHDLHDNTALRRDGTRHAVALAGDNDSDKKQVATLVHELGFEPLDIGLLAAGAHLEPGTHAFGASVHHSVLKNLVQKHKSEQANLL